MDIEFKQYILDDCIEGKLKCKDAAKLLGIHPKSFSRLKRRYLAEGRDALIRKKPGPKEFTPPNRTPREVEEQVVQIACEHADLSIEALAELLKDQFNIELHPTTVWRILKRCPPQEQQEKDQQTPQQPVSYFYYIDSPTADVAVSASSIYATNERVVTYSGLPHEDAEVSDE